jgi:serine acetyltransferase
MIDRVLLSHFGIEVLSKSIDCDDLVVGHSTGVVLGGNGIRCTGRLHVSSGVVFARKLSSAEEQLGVPFFDIEGDLTVGANSVVVGPSRIVGPVTIGALSYVDIRNLEPGLYVGSPARWIPPKGSGDS